MGWIEALAESDLPEGERKVVKLNKYKVLLLKHQGQIYGVENSCPHLKVPLSLGKVTPQGTLVCPLHRSAFSLSTGEVQDWTPFPPMIGPALGKISKAKPLPVFPTRIESGKIYVEIND